MNSKTVLLGAGAILLLAGAAAGYLYGVDSTPAKTTAAISTTTLTTTFTTSTSLNAYSQVADGFANHLRFLSSRNASAVVSQYEQNASVTWTGSASGLRGLYNGTKVILLLINASFITRAGSFSIGNVTRTISGISNESAVVNSTFDVSGKNYDFGLYEGYAASFNATVSAQDSFVYSTSHGAWLISAETWNFLRTNLQYPLPTTG